MTTEDDFQRALDANPDDWQTRLVLADWLEERGDPRAEGYRALGMMRLKPFPCAPRDTKPKQVRRKRHFYGDVSRVGPEYGDTTDYSACLLPSDWLAELKSWDVENGAYRWVWVKGGRRKAEDAATLAFAKLPAERRAELLATVAV
jgi:uncharacterized protein (TIGR02996 family)